MDKYSQVGLPDSGVVGTDVATSFLTSVYAWMCAGLALTTIVAWGVSGSSTMMEAITGNPALLWGLLLAELALVVVIGAAINRIPAGVATLLFLVYSALNGVTLSFIFLVYTEESVVRAFLSATCLFAAMSVYGYFTKRDLTSFGSMLRVGLIALIISMIINMFLRSQGFDYLISIVGVVIFLGLTAYDTQKILSFARGARGVDSATLRKGAILGALALYLDFINLFLYLLRLFGKKR